MSNIRKFEICQEHIKKVKKVFVGCDYLRVNFRGHHREFRKYLDNLNYTNSSFAQVKNGLLTFTYDKIPLSMGPAIRVSCVMDDVAYPLCLYNEFNEKTKNLEGFNKHARIDFYGSLYRLIEIGYVSEEFISETLSDITDSQSITLSRYDVAIDLFFNSKVKIEKPQKYFNGGIGAGTRIYPYYKGEELESFSVGTKDTGLYSLRVYNKILDTKSKGKHGLYSDYLKWRDVHRHEVEFRARRCKSIDWKDAYEKLAKPYAEKFLKKLYGFNANVKFYTYSEKHIRVGLDNRNIARYRKQTVSRIRSLARAGVNPFLLCWLAFKGKKREEYVKDFLSRPYIIRLNHTS